MTIAGCAQRSNAPHTVTHTFWGCIRESDTYALIGHWDREDWKAFGRVVEIGGCKKLEPGTVIETRNNDMTVVCVQPRGEPYCLWFPTARTSIRNR